MSDLISETPEVNTWCIHEKKQRAGSSVFGQISAGIIWIDNVGLDEEPVGGADPSKIIAQINSEGLPLYRGHDPGLPSGRTVAAKLFVSPNGIRFAAGILGFYVDELKLSFDDLGVDSKPAAASPTMLDIPPNNWWLDVAVDPREVDSQWLENLLHDAPLPVTQRELSHNAEDSQHELIRIGIVYVALVWNPFVTTVSQEAAKNVYAGIHKWLRRLWDELTTRNQPIVSIDSSQNGCGVSFLFRGKDVKRLYDAHDALPVATAQAAMLISNMRSRQVPPVEIVYEFDQQHSLWFPSYATLEDGRLVSDCNILIALEQHSTGLSLGIQIGKKKFLKQR